MAGLVLVRRDQKSRQETLVREVKSPSLFNRKIQHKYLYLYGYIYIYIYVCVCVCVCVCVSIFNDWILERVTFGNVGERNWTWSWFLFHLFAPNSELEWDRHLRVPFGSWRHFKDAIPLPRRTGAAGDLSTDGSLYEVRAGRLRLAYVSARTLIQRPLSPVHRCEVLASIPSLPSCRCMKPWRL